MKKNVILLIVTIVCFGVAIALTVRSCRPNPLEQARRTRQPLTLRCEACSHEFQVSREEFAKRLDGLEVIPPEALEHMHCPACKKQFSAGLVMAPGAERLGGGRGER